MITKDQARAALERMLRVSTEGHAGLVELLSEPPHDDGVALAKLSTCGLAIRAALYAAGVSSPVFERPYKPGEAFADLWELTGMVPWSQSPGRHLQRPGKDGAPHKELGIAVMDHDHVMIAILETTEADPFHLIGAEGGQVDPAGRQIVAAAIYRGMWIRNLDPYVGRDSRYHRRFTGWIPLSDD